MPVRALFSSFLLAVVLAAGITTGASAASTGLKAKVALGAIVWLGFASYVVVLGRAALARGHTGQLGQLDRGWDDVVVPTIEADAVAT